MALLTAATSRRQRRAEAAAGSNDDVDDHEHERAKPEIDADVTADADAASWRTRRSRTANTPSLRHHTTASPCSLPRLDLRQALWGALSTMVPLSLLIK